MGKPPLRDGDVRQQAGVEVGLGLLTVEAGSCLGVNVAGKAAPNKPRRNHTPGGEPPRVSNVLLVLKNIFSELFSNNWAKNTCGDVANQALSACLLKRNFER